MKVLILHSSARKHGNTAQLMAPFIDEMLLLDNECEVGYLCDMSLLPCTSCRACQKDWSVFGCVQKDDMQAVFDKILACDLLVLASPIYSWYCTPQMKTVLDRMVYGMNKFYGEKRGPALWAGKPVALITTCGYPVEKGADLWEEGMRRYCKHSRLRYLGMYVERFMGYNTVFMDSEKERRARRFAENVFAAAQEK